MITVQAVNTLAPDADGRQWTPKQYQERDAVLRALGVPIFGLTRSRAGDQETYAGPPETPVTR